MRIQHLLHLSLSRCLSLGATAVLCAALSLSARAEAQDQVSGWNWTVAPYLWGTGLNGAVGGLPGVPPAEIDVSFSTILKNLDMAGMVVVNGNNGRFGISGDVFYAKISGSSNSLAPLWSQTNLRVKETIITLMGEYNLSSGADHDLWAVAGARYWDVENQLTLLPGTRPQRSGTLQDSWVDPVIGLRGRKDLSDTMFLTGWALAGGFGVGSDEMVDLFGGLGYQFSDRTSGILGYRWLSVDRVDGNFVFDMKQQGPMLGVSIAF